MLVSLPDVFICCTLYTRDVQNPVRGYNAVRQHFETGPQQHTNIYLRITLKNVNSMVLFVVMPCSSKRAQCFEVHIVSIFTVETVVILPPVSVGFFVVLRFDPHGHKPLIILFQKLFENFPHNIRILIYVRLVGWEHVCTRNMFRPENSELTGRWKTSHSEKLPNLNSSSSLLWSLYKGEQDGQGK